MNRSPAVAEMRGRLQVSGPVGVLTMFSDRAEESALGHILRHCNWDVYAALTLREARRFLRIANVGVAVAQYRPFADFSWRDLIGESPAPRVVVTDRLGDEVMWLEALNRGAYDLLAQPFKPAEVFRVLSYAWRSWYDEQLRRPGEARLHAA